MQNVIDFLFGTNGIMPEGYYFLWSPPLLWLFVITIAFTALSFISIPIALGFFAYQRKGFEFKGGRLLFGAFIFSCLAL
ncbi:MAG: hypothetical protein Q8N96_02415 [Methylovulum sp.]|nr:hypothetical protein [Methylovulum sp.]